MACLSRPQCTSRVRLSKLPGEPGPTQRHMAPHARRERLPDTIFAIVRVKHSAASVWRRRAKRSVYGNRLGFRLCAGAVKPIHLPIRALGKSQALRAKFVTNRLARSAHDTLSKRHTEARRRQPWR